MRLPNPAPQFRNRQGFTLIELLVTMAIIAVLAAITVTVTSSIQQKANMKLAAEKLRNVGGAFVTYTSDNNGNLPWEDSVVGGNDWASAALPQNKEVWYNALPQLMNCPPVGELGSNPALFYDESYPLYLRGAGYPDGKKQDKKPLFAFAMNSRLQRKPKDGDAPPDPTVVKPQGRLAAITEPGRTVAFFERGLPGDDKKGKGVGGYDGGPKGNARNFVARYNGKGLIIFVDGHIDQFSPGHLIGNDGKIKTPQEEVVWTPDPEEDPN